MVNFQTMSATGQSPYSQIDRWRPSTSAGVYLSSNTSVNIIAGIILLVSSLNHDPVFHGRLLNSGQTVRVGNHEEGCTNSVKSLREQVAKM
ncbi:hypothetical protein HanXRQr2_Chr05g0205211 [Helianthus annuus]|uniref:Uncharacterized protein n=1 Tax=Helianthus annuus TaxID=4232 RepID=A0A251UMI1_HELAN|nr:hypothetical protein HanXRQr2_Chr05g0205211 [Helianthus annuus]KAJ0921968.1 hypothetical protein HanPSC8_Chr05g0197981 [Helianthus annuus]